MIKDIFLSFKDNFQEKTSNPFLGTYLLVWIIRNWELVYTLLNFDEEQKLQHKVAFVKHYYERYDFVINLFENTLWAFGLLILTYLLLNLSRLIINFSEKQLTPWVYKITDSKSIVLKEVYDKIKTEKYELEERLDKEREAKSNLDAKIKKLEEENTQLRVGNIQEITSESSEKPVGLEIQETSTDRIFKKLKDQDLFQAFIDISLKIKNNESITDDDINKKTFLNLDLIEFHRNSNINGKKFYTLTEDGKAILNKINLE